MEWRDLALIGAGLIGSGVAIIHGVLTERYMVRPFAELAGGAKPLPIPIQRLVPALLHFSTFNWFIGGLGLIIAAFWLEGEARVATALLVASSYLFGAVGNLWSTRRPHPGWMLYAVALVLIAIGATPP